MNSKKLILFILLILFAISMGYSYWRMPLEKRVAKLTYAPGMRAPVPRKTSPPPKATVPAPSSAADEKAVHLSQLEKTAAGFKGYRRNIFRPIFHDEIKEILPPLSKVAPPPVLPPPPQPKPLVPPVTPVPELTPLQRDMAQFTFLGFMKKDGHKTIFLAKDKDILLVKKGDRIAGKYEATGITEERLTIKALDGSGEIVIPLVEQKPLSAPRK
ncbi:MAG: hypothetical protein HYS23_11975 [Geobacter sp.]|nr:hypothetical protein [Geobacter sp.]